MVGAKGLAHLWWQLFFKELAILTVTAAPIGAPPPATILDSLFDAAGWEALFSQSCLP